MKRMKTCAYKKQKLETNKRKCIQGVSRPCKRQKLYNIYEELSNFNELMENGMASLPMIHIVNDIYSELNVSLIEGNNIQTLIKMYKTNKRLLK